MKIFSLVLLVCLLPSCSIAYSPLVKSFLGHLTTSLSLLPQDNIEKEFDIRTPSYVKAVNLLSPYDRFFVLLNENYTVYDFVKKSRGIHSWGLQNVEYIGGQNHSLIVVCRESFLCRYPFAAMIDSYASFPALARVLPSVFEKVSDSMRNHSHLTLEVMGLPGYSDRKIDLSFVDLSESKEESSSSVARLLSIQPSLKSAKSLLKVYFNPLLSLLSEGGVDVVSLPRKYRLSHLRQLNDYMRGAVGNGARSASISSSSTWQGQHGLTGRNIIVGVGDTGVDYRSTYFYDPNYSVRQAESRMNDHRKIPLYVPLIGSDEAVTDGHGTHVCGIIAGKANSDDVSVSRYNGVAEDSRILFVDIADSDDDVYLPSNLHQRYYPLFYQNSVRISSNSWGAEEYYTYDSQCSQTDQFVWEHNDMVVLFAAGNDGDKGLNTVTTPALSKNVITVGATHSARSSSEDLDYITYFSSRGNPTSQYIKPDVVAQGEEISAQSFSSSRCGQSCNNHLGTVKMQGTSMATPAVAGAVALIEQYLSEGGYHNQTVDMRASLIKAMIVHSGQPTLGYCTRVYCQQHSSMRMFYEGHGRVQLDRVLHYAGESDFELFLYYGQLNNNKRSFEIQVPIVDLFLHDHSSKSFKVTMVYTDPAASAYSTNVLVNQVDVSVTNDAGTSTFYPNNRDDADHYNNVQVIELSSSQVRQLIQSSDNLHIIVSCGSLSTSYQPVSLVITGAFDFDSVAVDDDRSKDEEDKPAEIREGISIEISEYTMLVIIVAVCIILYVYFAAKSMCSKKKSMPVTNASQTGNNRRV